MKRRDNLFQAVAKGYSFHLVTVGKCAGANGNHAVRNRQGRQFLTGAERAIINGDHAVRNR